MKEKTLVQVSLPSRLAAEIDQLVRKGTFASPSEALEHGARLVVHMSRRTHERAEKYAYDEIKEGILRGKKNPNKIVWGLLKNNPLDAQQAKDTLRKMFDD